MMRDILNKYMIPELYTSLSIPIPTTAVASFNITTKLQTQIGWIYGLGVTVASSAGGTVSAINQTLITQLQASLLYLQLKKGQALALDTVRLDKYVYTSPSATAVTGSDDRYFQTGIPGNISLDQSTIFNPTLLSAGLILIDFWYLDNQMVDYLLQQGEIKMPPTVQQEIGLKRIYK